MREETILYKIKRNTASEYSINVETFNASSTNEPHLLFCGGFRSTMRGNKANFLAQLSRQNSWGFTRFDYFGHGDSDGLAEHGSLHDWLADTLAVIDSIPVPVILVGSSMGAWLAVHTCLQRPDKVRALATIAAAPDFTQELMWPALSSAQQQTIQSGQSVSIPTMYGGDDWRVRNALFDSGRALSLLDNTEPLAIHIPIRMLHGTADVDVPWQLSQRLLDRCSHSVDAALTLIAGADHRLSDDNGLEHLQNALNYLSSRRTTN